MSEVSYRWIDGPTCTDKEWAAVDLILEAQGWMPLNRDTSRVYLAERDGQIVGLSCQQLMPFSGPLWVDKKFRGTGIADRLADDNLKWLEDNVRGWFVIADSPHVPKFCERYRMHKITSPVYITDSQGQKEVN